MKLQAVALDTEDTIIGEVDVSDEEPWSWKCMHFIFALCQLKFVHSAFYLSLIS